MAACSPTGRFEPAILVRFGRWIERIPIAPEPPRDLVEKCRDRALPVYARYINRRGKLRFWTMGKPPPRGWKRWPPSVGMVPVKYRGVDD